MTISCDLFEEQRTCSNITCPAPVSRVESLRTASPPCDNRHISVGICQASHPQLCFYHRYIAMEDGRRRSKKRSLIGQGALGFLLSIQLLPSVVSANVPVYFGSPSGDSPILPPQIPLAGSPSLLEAHEFVSTLHMVVC